MKVTVRWVRNGEACKMVCADQAMADRLMKDLRGISGVSKIRTEKEVVNP